MKRKHGFTMIELLAVLVILGIIMIIAVPAVVSYMQGARADYYEKLEASLTASGQEYFSDHRNLMPKENGQIDSINIKDLVSQGYTSEILDSDGNDTCTGNVYIKRLATAEFEYHACISCGKVDSVGNQEYKSTSSFCTSGSTGGTEGGTCDKPKENPTDDCFMITVPDSFKVPQCTTVEDSAASQGISLDGIVKNNGEDIGDRITADTTAVDYKNIGNYKVYYTYKQVLNPFGEKYNTSVTIYDDKAPSKTNVEMHLESSTGMIYNCSEGNCSWTGKDVYITFTANDLSDCATEGSGVKQFAYRYGETGNWQYVDATKTQLNGKNVYQATIVRNTTHKGILDVKAIDNAMSTGNSTNNEGEITRVYLQVDKTPPSCTSSGGNSNWISATSNPGTITLTGTCNDAHSGCAGNVTKTYSTDINSTTESPGTVYDNVGNSTVCPGNQTVKIDKIAPTVSVTPNPGTYNDSVSPKVTCNGGTSGTKSGDKSTTFNTRGTFTISGTCIDNAGNSKSYSYSYKVQKYEANASVCGTSQCNPHKCNCRNECAEYGITSSVFIDAGCASDPKVGCPCCTGSGIPNCWVYNEKCGGWQTTTGCIRYENRCDTCYDQCANSCWF